MTRAPQPYVQHLKALDLIGKGFVKAMSLLLRAYLTSDRTTEARRVFVKQAYPVVLDYRQQSYEQGVKFLLAEAKRQGVDPGTLRVPPVMEYTQKVLDIKLNAITSGDTPAPYAAVMAEMIRHVKVPANQVVMDNADPSPAADARIFVGDDTVDFSKDVLLTPEEAKAFTEIVADKARQSVEERQATYAEAWAADKAAEKERRLDRRRAQGITDPATRRRYKYARVLTGDDNCAFCVMLASRGPVYSSADRAATKGEIVPIQVTHRGKPTQIWYKAIKRIDTIGDTYHPNCDCVAVPVFVDEEEFAGRETVDGLFKIWETAQDVETATDKGDHSLNRLRTYLRQNPDILSSVVPHMRSDYALVA
ncbi:MAG TPA: hypothetical protein VF885_26680 [Arthrobacter sp.]